MALIKRIKKAVQTRLSAALAKPDVSGVNLNVGSGFTSIPGFISLDFDSDWYRRKRRNFVHYDMMSDDLPYGTGEVDSIYCSHVIEHLPSSAVRRFLGEARRVLKPGGVLRIATPDAEFLWEVSSFDNRYWDWRGGWFDDAATSVKPPGEPVSQADFFVREVATPISRHYRHARERRPVDQSLFAGDRRSTIAELQAGLEFDPKLPGDHINAWEYERLAEVGREAGFEKIVRSKWRGSVSSRMQGRHFDRTAPQMSLYVEMVR